MIFLRQAAQIRQIGIDFCTWQAYYVHMSNCSYEQEARYE